MNEYEIGYAQGQLFETTYPTPPGANAQAMLEAAIIGSRDRPDNRWFWGFVDGALDVYFGRKP